MPKAVKKILIVEDDIPTLNVYELKFSQEGFKIITAEDGETGLNLALQEQPDLILLDLLLPKMDGITMLRKLREDAWGKNAQVIILTNLTVAEKEREARELGALDYIIKSDWTLKDIVVKVKQKLGL